MGVMDRRVAITQATFDHWQGKPFEWGRHDCVKLAAQHLRSMGHRVKFAKAGAYSSALGAQRALRRAGFSSLAEGLDAQFLPRIPVAAAVEGDIIMLDGEGLFDALGIYLGNQAILGFHEDMIGASALRIVAATACWQVVPK
jgi:hypothetical protein